MLIWINGIVVTTPLFDKEDQTAPRLITETVED